VSNETKTDADAGRLKHGVRPVAWIGPVWQLMNDHIYEAWADKYPDDAKYFQPLYDKAAIDAAVAAERERWQRIAQAAQALTTCGTDQIDQFEIPAHLMAALALALDEGPTLSAHDGWPKLTKPARVGNGTFGIGVSARLVVEAAQRLHQYTQDGTLDKARAQASTIACTLELVRAGQAKAQALIDAGKCPDCEGAGIWGGQFTAGEHACETCRGTGKA
jgi:hypothetical protein